MRDMRTASAIVLLSLLALVLLPGVAAAHSTLEASDPGAGATLTVPPTAITGDFSEDVDASRSSMELRGPDGAQIAKGGVPADGPPTRMAISALPALAPGVYEVRWTTVTADDNGVERGTFTFTVVEAAPGSTPAPTTTSVPIATTTAPAASPSPEPAPTAGPGDLLLPIVVLGAILVGGAAVFLRRRR
jgi:methionine-rich copper-binding protein CopC